ncbi:MAG TPA: TonB-dependent receptor [Rhizomicrobium sp.]|jgi:outer membrane receptor protein involved in Fe transport|nr:TonB-dependent receptor [Rhizomicrobium sp.]
MNGLRNAFLSGAAVGLALTLTSAAHAENFSIPGGTLADALDSYSAQTGVALAISTNALKGVRTHGASGNMSPEQALTRILSGTGFGSRRVGNAVAIVRDTSRESELVPTELQSIQLAQATSTPRASVETVTVTSSKLGGADVQSIPIAITALSQEQLTATQTAGGPDLVKQVPNLTFTKTNFTGYSIQVRGIGTQAISVATDPAVAVAFNDTPFIRNHFFEQEFYDLSQVEVLRGPQGTLYGRNATAGVVNITSAKPTDQFEAMASADIGNYKNRRFEGMINIPFVSDKLDLRIAGEWTKRDGYSLNETTNQQIDGRDLWSTRATLHWKPTSNLQADLIWEHFAEDDDRLRSGKQLCKNDPGPATLTAADGSVVPVPPAQGNVFSINASYFSQGCLSSSLYSKDAFQVPNGFSLPFVNGASFESLLNSYIDPYASTTQSTNLRNIQSAFEPKYKAKNDTMELNASWNVSPTLTLYSDTGYNRDWLWSSEDYNRFNTTPGVFLGAGFSGNPYVDENGVFCDPQLGCSDRLVVQDLATEHSWQLSQEFRLSSNFSGPFNFSAGGNYLHYETEENYYVFSNTFTMISLNNVNCGATYIPGTTNDLYCLNNGRSYQPGFPNIDSIPTEAPQYLDPNPIASLDNEGHNYFLSQNPYNLNSYAVFGEAYYNITPDLKLTGGLRWTDDQKHFTDIPSELLVIGYGYPTLGHVDQSWSKFTGRAVANWTPKLSFTDQSLFYASYAHGYKAGGANPPGPVLLNADTGFTAAGVANNIAFPVHPLTFKPEYVDAFEAGTKNTAVDGALTLNGDVFFYDYKGYQISQIVDRTAINLNFDATVKGAELEATWEPVPGLKFSFAGGYEQTRIKNGQQAIDLIDRTAGHPGWVVMKPSVGQSSNCILPEYVAAALVQTDYGGEGDSNVTACGTAYAAGLDPVTTNYYNSNTTSVLGPGGISHPYPGYDPLSVDPNAPANVNNGLGLPPNNGEGFAKDLSGNELPNAPHFTVSLGADYTIPVSPDWAATLHGDFYWQDKSWARVFNDDPYDRIRGYTNVNLALILTDQSGWQFMGYVKNVFDTTAITGDFLNSDDSGLTTNIFLTDPRLFGVRVTKHFDGGGMNGGTGFDFLDSDSRPQLWLQLGGNFNAALADATSPYEPTASDVFPNGGTATPNWPVGLPTPAQLQHTPNRGFDWEGSLAFTPPDTDWVLKAGVRYGRTSRNKHYHKSMIAGTKEGISFFGYYRPCSALAAYGGALASGCYHGVAKEFVDSQDASSEQHTMLDFTLGKDIGIGVFGNGGKSIIAAGVRFAQFHSQMAQTLGADPHYNLSVNIFQKYHEVWEFDSHENRSFHGVGPELTWDGNTPIWGDEDDAQITLDMGVNVAVLFGRQKSFLRHNVNHCVVQGFGTLAVCEGQTIGGDIDGRVPEPPDNVNRSRTVTVLNIGGYLGASMRYRNGKVSFGYRADTFFNAMDGGQETAKSYNRGFYGPYLNVSLGL